ncbi:5-(carboxyamino)imidazole ribonucleotide synthase [Meiothermus taiwanensis]|uniref:N5-carboxyaminoimidazole ribonucleotide synthase n=2 Tax=Meiothermus taiwanensis TaxID=172827 RepID=A0A399E0I7_9DEIN|nr:phosphoribosylaminoimidazole carboxylase, ATPase subunit [Meiothermus taiwanensis WR-220]KIQ54388.1 phosphoribosylaminoimidazole carboxylase [Meiothermus taiwanensis]KZK14631.1 5-(carboxyamino)imidazole ribonucleotide synthase [Meiothermus taiwanensis]RIH77606.1 N5-carboxyaminoimidazole ribonucleotide synthase [Meiothermus taiwanensis]
MGVQIGVLGGGQLGRMLALAGYPLGLGFRFFDTAPEAPAGQLAELVVGDYADEEALARFAEGLSLLTYEFENVPLAAVARLAQSLPVYPPPGALEVAQDRLAEKTFFQGLGIPTPLFYPVQTHNDLLDGLERTGWPALLKTRRMGYDGKGQRLLRSPADLEAAWAQLGGQPLILEAFVPFERELSILAVRSTRGQVAFYPLVENHHEKGILRKSLAPAPATSARLQHQAEELARRVMERLDYVGVLAIELFEMEGVLWANEMAPRVHNSGHWTLEGAETSQFENHLRAILGLPLGSTAPRGRAAMLNLIGQRPEFARVLEIPGAHLHWYGKEVRPGRKVGHVTLRADTPEVLQADLRRLEAVLAETKD